jgi:hypothetical protein
MKKCLQNVAPNCLQNSSPLTKTEVLLRTHRRSSLVHILTKQNHTPLRYVLISYCLLFLCLPCQVFRQNLVIHLSPSHDRWMFQPTTRVCLILWSWLFVFYKLFGPLSPYLRQSLFSLPLTCVTDGVLNKLERLRSPWTNIRLAVLNSWLMRYESETQVVVLFGGGG